MKGFRYFAMYMRGREEMVLSVLNQPLVRFFCLTDLMTNVSSHPGHLDESIVIFRGPRSNFSILFHFFIKKHASKQNSPDLMPHFAASHLGLFCLPIFHKKDARLKV